MPKVSIILTSYNHSKYLREAIESCLNQSFTNFELIILDDCSTDNSWEIINQYTDPRIKAFRSENQGEVVPQVNKAISEIATGEYIAIHHSDDVWELDKLEKQVAFLDSHPEIGAVFTNALPITEDSSPLKDENHFYFKIFDQPNRSRHEWLRYFFVHSNALCHPSALLRKQVYRDCGLYRNGLAQSADFNMWIRLCMKHDIHVMPEKMVKFRIRSNEANASGSRPDTRIRWAYELYKSFDLYKDIDNAEEFFKIFPSMKKFDRQDNTDLGFVLAMAAFDEENTFSTRQLFGIEILFQIISDSVRSIKVESAYGFGVNEFIALTAKYDFFSREEVFDLSQRLQTLYGQIANLNQNIVERYQQIDNLNKVIAELYQTIGNRDNEIALIYQSKSWKLTAPLRFIRRKMGNWPTYCRKLISDFARWFWHTLPFPNSYKQKLKAALFINLPFLLSWTRGYRDWRNMTAGNTIEARHNALVLINTEHSSLNDCVFVPLFNGKPLKDKPAKLICFYLPQFHPIPENDAWWGVGFTEWSNVQPAGPQFEGHYQPHVPGELGYYNLLDPEVQHRQVELAKLYGVEGFCFYFYWFSGKRLLEIPIQNYLEDRSLDLPFCLCWANENWSRRWDGLENDILIAQHYSPEDDIAFIEHVARYLRDSRYIRIDGKPLLLIYRPSLLPSAKETAARWRTWCRDHGIGELYLAYTQSFETVDPASYGFDAAIEFPPNNSSPPNITDKVQPLHADFACNVYDWNVFVERSQNYKKPKYTLFRGVCPSWDNTARRKNNSSILLNSSPRGYQQWLFNAINETYRRVSNPEQRLIFINAWNEWAEGTHLEPDQRYGYAYLEATRMALVRKTLIDSQEAANNKHSLAVVIHAFYEDVFDEILDYLKNVHQVPLKLYVTTTHELVESLTDKLQHQQHDFFVLPVNNRGRDILPFIKIMPEVLKGRHNFLIKAHTKKSVHRQDGAVWRKDIFDKLLSELVLANNLSYLANNPEIGILGPTEHIVPMSFYWGSNSARVVQLAERLCVDHKALATMNFVAGTMFIARIKAMIPLLNLALSEEDFEPEEGQIDGTLAHALERLFSVSAFAVNLKITCPEKKITEGYKYAKKVVLS